MYINRLVGGKYITRLIKIMVISKLLIKYTPDFGISVGVHGREAPADVHVLPHYDVVPNNIIKHNWLRIGSYVSLQLKLDPLKDKNRECDINQ